MGPVHRPGLAPLKSTAPVSAPAPTSVLMFGAKKNTVPLLTLPVRKPSGAVVPTSPTKLALAFPIVKLSPWPAAAFRMSSGRCSFSRTDLRGRCGCRSLRCYLPIV